MQSLRFLLSMFVATTMAGAASASSKAPLIDNSQVIPLTKFLEEQPLNADAPVARAALLEWEDKSADVMDVVCPGVLSPIPDKSIKYNGELIAQFIFGSAAYQLANPAEKGKLMPSQLAGMKSMLKAYRTIVARDANARIPRFDELSRDEADGKLLKVLEPLVIANCKSAEP